MSPASTPTPESPGSASAPARSPAQDLDAEYRQAREECALFRPEGRVWIAVTGPDAAEFLQGQVTNEIEALSPGSGCFALLLDRKARIQAEMRILKLAEGELLLETGSDQVGGLLKHLGMYKIGRKVEITETDRVTLSLFGPGTAEATGLAPGPEYTFTETRLAGADCLAVSTLSGLDVTCDRADVAAVEEEMERRHAIPVSAAAVEILRVESGRPRFGQDITAASMPAEAGLVERAINFEKGCYIGQEPVARLHYRGRPNRRLRGLRFSEPVSPGDTVRLAERELGTIGTAVLSPALGRIGLAILRREAEPGTTVTVISESGESPAEVVELPFTETGL